MHAVSNSASLRNDQLSYTARVDKQSHNVYMYEKCGQRKYYANITTILGTTNNTAALYKHCTYCSRDIVCLVRERLLRHTLILLLYLASLTLPNYESGFLVHTMYKRKKGQYH